MQLILEFSASLLQSSVSHDSSEIILICWIYAQEIYSYYHHNVYLYISVENTSAA